MTVPRRERRDAGSMFGVDRQEQAEHDVQQGCGDAATEPQGTADEKDGERLARDRDRRARDRHADVRGERDQERPEHDEDDVTQERRDPLAEADRDEEVADRDPALVDGDPREGRNGDRHPDLRGAGAPMEEVYPRPPDPRGPGRDECRVGRYCAPTARTIGTRLASLAGCAAATIESATPSTVTTAIAAHGGASGGAFRPPPGTTRRPPTRTPATEPITAATMPRMPASTRMLRQTWRRLIPAARRTPISRPRSETPIDSVFATPRTATITAISPSRSKSPKIRSSVSPTVLSTWSSGVGVRSERAATRWTAACASGGAPGA